MEIEVKQVAKQPTLGIRTTTTLDRIGETLGTIYPKISQYIREKGIVPAGPPFALYHAFAPDHIELEGGIPLTEAIEGEGDIVGSELPEGKAATAWHIGHYDSLKETYQTMEKWMKENGIEPSFPCWEIYWTDPGEVEDSSQWKTEIFWRVK
jgi:effector-binding domain-containing protein